MCRRAERAAVRLAESGQEVKPEVLAYLNRLSDLVWLFGRLIELNAGIDARLRDETKAWPEVVAGLVGRIPGKLLEGRAHSRSLGYAPDFLSGLMASVNFMRLSSKKAAYVDVREISVVGNPEFVSRDDKVYGEVIRSALVTPWVGSG